RSRNWSATSVSKKSGLARACSRSASCSSRPVIDPAPSAVNTPSSTAESRTFAGQKAMPTSMIRAGESWVMTVSSLLCRARHEFPDRRLLNVVEYVVLSQAGCTAVKLNSHVQGGLVSIQQIGVIHEAFRIGRREVRLQLRECWRSQDVGFDLRDVRYRRVRIAVRAAVRLDGRSGRSSIANPPFGIIRTCAVA